jgi:hypothetical protein
MYVRGRNPDIVDIALKIYLGRNWVQSRFATQSQGARLVVSFGVALKLLGFAKCGGAISLH